MPKVLINAPVYRAKVREVESVESLSQFFTSATLRYSNLQSKSAHTIECLDKAFGYLKSTCGSFKRRFRFVRYLSNEEVWTSDKNGIYAVSKNIKPFLIADLICAFFDGEYSGCRMIDYLSRTESVLHGTSVAEESCTSNIKLFGESKSKILDALQNYYSLVDDLSIPFSSHFSSKAEALTKVILEETSKGWVGKFLLSPGATNVTEQEILLDSFCLFISQLKNFLDTRFTAGVIDIENAKTTALARYLNLESDPIATLAKLYAGDVTTTFYEKVCDSISVSTKDVFSFEGRAKAISLHPDLPTKLLINVFDAASEEVLKALKLMNKMTSHLGILKEYITDVVCLHGFEDRVVPGEIRALLSLYHTEKAGTTFYQDVVDPLKLKAKVEAEAPLVADLVATLNSVIQKFYVEETTPFLSGISLHHCHDKGRDCFYALDLFSDEQPSQKFISFSTGGDGKVTSVRDLVITPQSSKLAPELMYSYKRFQGGSSLHQTPLYGVWVSGSDTDLRNSLMIHGKYIEVTTEPVSGNVTCLVCQELFTINPPSLGKDVPSFFVTKRKEAVGTSFKIAKIDPESKATDLCDLLFSFEGKDVLNASDKDLEALYFSRLSELLAGTESVPKHQYLNTSVKEVVSPTLAYFTKGLFNVESDIPFKTCRQAVLPTGLDLKNVAMRKKALLPASVDVPAYIDMSYQIVEAMLTTAGLSSLKAVGKIEGPVTKDGGHLWTITPLKKKKIGNDLYSISSNAQTILVDIDQLKPEQAAYLCADSPTECLVFDSKSNLEQAIMMYQLDSNFSFLTVDKVTYAIPQTNDVESSVKMCETKKLATRKKLFAAKLKNLTDVDEQVLLSIVNVANQPIFVKDETLSRGLEPNLLLTVHVPVEKYINFAGHNWRKNGASLRASLRYGVSEIDSVLLTQNIACVSSNGDSGLRGCFKRKFYLASGVSRTEAILNRLLDLLCSVYASFNTIRATKISVDTDQIILECQQARCFFTNNFDCSDTTISMIGGFSTSPLSALTEDLKRLETMLMANMGAATTKHVLNIISLLSPVNLAEMMKVGLHIPYPVAGSIDRNAMSDIIAGRECGLPLPIVVESMRDLALEDTLGPEFEAAVRTAIVVHLNSLF